MIVCELRCSPQNVTINKTVLIRFRIHSTTSKLDGKATDDKISFPIKVIVVSVRQRERKNHDTGRDEEEEDKDTEQV